ncbi:homeobox protein NANOG-like [Ammospiza nelsoni]|uniref:homeobox protein NANOG-like n=1 Tax=Ammospiza caudacuta TaxID=2857398 RepID=UPI00273A47E2|nr:homeobox protein NANOG-like [Ammospiza caudacuta]XP_059349921.1 homeobox protein NANOG-like [Ammospiza nelsoni]
MCAHLALPPRPAYPGGAARGRLELGWSAAGAAAQAPTAAGHSPQAAGGRHTAEVSPASSSSGNFSQFIPDSATSPHSSSSSPQPSAKSQKGREYGVEGIRKTKSRTAFSKEQLLTLHQRFQSQKYLSPQQIRELAVALGLTYKQVKTWFQNRRMKLKRCQKQSLWSERAQCLTQSGFQSGTYLDVHPKFHQGYPITAAGNMQAMPAPCQHYGAGQNAYTILTSEDGGVFGKGGGTCSVQQTVGFIAQHKVDFYHSYPGTVEYPGSKTGDGCNFHHSATMGAPFPTAASHHLYHS